MEKTEKFKTFAASALLITSLLAAFWLPITTAYAQNKQNKARRPNIIFILTDDLGWSELGSYGNRFNETPNLDRLAREGVRFTQAYAAAPVCSPTRAALMSGQFPARVGINDYLDVRDVKHLSPSYTTLNELLKNAGYKTGIVGKWHLTGDYTLGRGAPEKHGWDEVIASERKYIADGDYSFPYFFLPDLTEKLPAEYLTDRLNLEAVDFIKRHKDKPFFLYLANYAVHTKLAGKPELVQKYRAKPDAGKDRNNPELAAMLESVDRGVGEIVQTLADLNLSDDTIIVFTSDNGGETRVTSNAPLRAGKSTLYEGGIREPLIIKYPRLIGGGSVANQPVVTMDFYPTLLELAGARHDKTQTMDGRSFAAVLRNPNKTANATLYWYYPLPKPHFLGGRSAEAIRDGDYKLIRFFDDNRTELYDLKNDISERKDLAGTMPAKVRKLRQKLASWRARTVTTTPRFDEKPFAPNLSASQKSVVSQLEVCRNRLQARKCLPERPARPILEQ